MGFITALLALAACRAKTPRQPSVLRPERTVLPVPQPEGEKRLPFGILPPLLAWVCTRSSARGSELYFDRR